MTQHFGNLYTTKSPNFIGLVYRNCHVWLILAIVPTPFHFLNFFMTRKNHLHFDSTLFKNEEFAINEMLQNLNYILCIIKSIQVLHFFNSVYINKCLISEECGKLQRNFFCSLHSSPDSGAEYKEMLFFWQSAQ